MVDEDCPNFKKFEIDKNWDYAKIQLFSILKGRRFTDS